MIKNLNALENISTTETERQLARERVIKHDKNPNDILEILGLPSVEATAFVDLYDSVYGETESQSNSSIVIAQSERDGSMYQEGGNS